MVVILPKYNKGAKYNAVTMWNRWFVIHVIHVTLLFHFKEVSNICILFIIFIYYLIFIILFLYIEFRIKCYMYYKYNNGLITGGLHRYTSGQCYTSEV